MMKRNLFYLGIIVVMLFTSCNKPKVVCEIKEPQPNASITLGTIIKLTVFAEAENAIVSEVQIYVDDVGYETKFFFPYNFYIYTDKLKEGIHTIRAVAIASGGIKSVATVSFNLTKYESPDFVSFSDGKIPKGWITRNDEWNEGWSITSPGFDDNYAIKSTECTDVIARKTVNANINRIEFYAKNSENGWSTLRFYIDDAPQQQDINLTQSWEKYSFEIPQGEHTLRWMINGLSGGTTSFLDAIRFFKE